MRVLRRSLRLIWPYPRKEHNPAWRTFGAGGEEERPDLLLVPEFAGAGCVLRAPAAGGVEGDDLGERRFGLHR